MNTVDLEAKIRGQKIKSSGMQELVIGSQVYSSFIICAFINPREPISFLCIELDLVVAEFT